MSFALDVNILLYASDESGPHFEKARSFIESCIIQQSAIPDRAQPQLKSFAV